MRITGIKKLRRSCNMCKLLEDYYKLSKGVSEIAKQENVNASAVYEYISEIGLFPRKYYYTTIDTGIPELNEKLKHTYMHIANRCGDSSTARRKYGRIYMCEYLTVIEWSSFCNNNKGVLLKLWQKYVGSGKKHIHAISIDRKDSGRGYTSENMQFITAGCNSWKRNVRPLKITKDGESNYFMSATEAQEYYGINRQRFGDILRGKELYSNKYIVENSTVEEVLKHNNVKSLEEYYIRLKEVIK